MVKCEYCGKDLDSEDHVVMEVGGAKLHFCKEHAGLVKCSYCLNPVRIEDAIRILIGGKKKYFCSVNHLELYLGSKKGASC